MILNISEFSPNCLYSYLEVDISNMALNVETWERLLPTSKVSHKFSLVHLPAILGSRSGLGGR